MHRRERVNIIFPCPSNNWPGSEYDKRIQYNTGGFLTILYEIVLEEANIPAGVQQTNLFTNHCTNEWPWLTLMEAWNEVNWGVNDVNKIDEIDEIDEINEIDEIVEIDEIEVDVDVNVRWCRC